MSIFLNGELINEITKIGTATIFPNVPEIRWDGWEAQPDSPEKCKNI